MSMLSNSGMRRGRLYMLKKKRGKKKKKEKKSKIIIVRAFLSIGEQSHASYG